MTGAMQKATTADSKPPTVDAAMETPRANPLLPARVILNPSRQVGALEGVPGILSKIAGIEPAAWEAQKQAIMNTTAFIGPM